MQTQRRYELDWLRVLVILAIFVFHCTRFFDTDDWSIKNTTTYLAFDIWKQFATSWGMPLILVISGASAFLALDKVKPWKYIQGIFARLFLPLVLGMFTHVAFQVYLENLYKGMFSGSFLDFYPHYFDGMYGFGGNFAWMGLHLWYLELLFFLSLICLPIFIGLKNTNPGKSFLIMLGNLLAKPGAVLLFTLPLIYLIRVLDPETWGNKDLGGWSVVIYVCFFVSGFVIISNARLQARIQQIRWYSLGVGILLTFAYLFLDFQTFSASLQKSGKAWVDPLLCLVSWSWLFTVLGFGMKHLTFTNPFLKYANEAALPFYILHQTVIVCLGYFVMRWMIPDWVKFFFTLFVSFGITLGCYEFLVRRSNILRFLFGMKTIAKSQNQLVDTRLRESI